MSALVKQINDYANELGKNFNAQNFQNKIEDCNVIDIKLREQVSHLTNLAKTYHLLNEYQVEGTINKLSSSALIGRFRYGIELLKTVQKIWNEEKEELRQKEDFGMLLAHITLCNTEFEQHLLQFWSSYESELRNSFFVEWSLLKGIAHVPEQSKLYEEYSEKLQQFNLLFKKLPKLPDELKLVQSLAIQLSQLKNQMNFEVPRAVQEFFATFNNTTAEISLQILSLEVFQWLVSNQLLDSFVIRRQWKA